MSCFLCEGCDRLLDGDRVEAYEWGAGIICIDCHVELTPEDFDDYILKYDPKPIPDRNHDWEVTHKDYDGAPIDSLDTGSPDDRHFTGASLEEVWGQVIDYNEESK